MNQKPDEWAVDPALIDPEWQWFWDDLEFAVVSWGGTMVELVKGRTPSAKNGTPVPLRIVDGQAHHFDGNHEYLDFTDDNAYDITGEITLIWHGIIDTDGGGILDRHFASKHAGGGGTNNPFDFRTDSASPPNSFLVRANASGAIQYLGPDVTINTLHTVGVSGTAAMEDGVTFYIDGDPTSASAIGSETGPPTAASAPLRVGARATSGPTMDGKTSVVYGLSRMLSDAEHLRVVEDVFGPLRMADETFGFVAAVGGLSIPVAVHHMRQQRGY